MRRSSSPTPPPDCSGSSARRSRRAAGSAPRTTSRCARAAGEADDEERLRAVRTLVAEETRIGMLVGVAVGFELARELARSHRRQRETDGDPVPGPLGLRPDRGRHDRAGRPVPDGQPEGRRVGRRGRRERDPAHARPRRPLSATPSPSPSAPARRSWRSSSSPARSARSSAVTTRSSTRTSAARSSSTGARCALTPAWHTSTTPKGTVNTPAGLVIEIGGKRIYHLGDTALFSDLQLAGKRGKHRCGADVHRRPLHDGPLRRGRGGASSSAPIS